MCSTGSDTKCGSTAFQAPAGLSAPHAGLLLKPRRPPRPHTPAPRNPNPTASGGQRRPLTWNTLLERVQNGGGFLRQMKGGVALRWRRVRSGSLFFLSKSDIGIHPSSKIISII